jgi:hypothetical protein
VPQYKNKKFWEELIADFPWYDTGHIENDASNNFYIACVFVTAGNDREIYTERLPSNQKGIFTEPLPSNDRGDTQTNTHTQQRDLIRLLNFFRIREVG